MSWISLFTSAELYVGLVIGLLAGIAVGIAVVWLTTLITRVWDRTGGKAAEPAKVARVKAASEVRPEPVIKPVVPGASPSIVISRQASAPVQVPKTVVSVPPPPRVDTVAEDVTGEDDSAGADASDKLIPRQYQRFWYYVTNNEKPFASLLEALAAFPEEVGKYSARNRPLWDSLPEYVKENIKRIAVEK